VLVRSEIITLLRYATGPQARPEEPLARFSEVRLSNWFPVCVPQVEPAAKIVTAANNVSS
jgi:hypothetical protein